MILRSTRARLALAVTLSTLAVVASVGLLTWALASWRADDPQPQVRAGATQVADGVAVVIVADDVGAGAVADARADALRWMAVALAVSVLPALAVGWWVSARMIAPVDRAMAEVAARERDRRRRLDEVIHELRTPLAVAGTNLELAATDPAIPTETATLIDAAQRANERMRRTVDDLAEHGGLQVHRSDLIDLAAEVRAVVAEHTGPARARRLQLCGAGLDRLLVEGGDRAAVRTALGNLVSNAVRLAPAGSTITVVCAEHGDWAVAAVVDEGPGIPPDEHALVFERGWRGRHDRDRGGDGGLGLTIARQLVEANGGLLTLESAEGVGSVFAVWLPLSTAARADDVLAADGVHHLASPWRQRTSELSVTAEDFPRR